MSTAHKSSKKSGITKKAGKRGRSSPFPYNAVAAMFTLGTVWLNAISQRASVSPTDGQAVAAQSREDMMLMIRNLIPYGALLSAYTPQLAKSLKSDSPQTVVFITYFGTRLQRGKLKGIGAREHKELWEDVWQNVRDYKSVAEHRAATPRDGTYADWKDKTEKKVTSKFNRLVRSHKKLQGKIVKIEAQVEEMLSSK